MHYHYQDIRKRIAEEPTWFDEHGVPRWEAFSPRAVANIYAKEVVLLHIECQSCRRAFRVAMSSSDYDTLVQGSPALQALVERKAIAYGDPPNIGCCPAGPTMSSDTRRVLQFWKYQRFEWSRVAKLEIAIDPDWETE